MRDVAWADTSALIHSPKVRKGGLLGQTSYPKQEISRPSIFIIEHNVQLLCMSEVQSKREVRASLPYLEGFRAGQNHRFNPVTRTSVGHL